jgi:hypothetical protein
VTVEQFDRRPRWEREMLRSVHLGHATKLVLFVLAKHMRDDCKVSVTRAVIAGELGWNHVSRVSWHIKAAHEAGFLVTVRPGSYGRAAIWQGVLPTPLTVRKAKTVTSAETQKVSVRNVARNLLTFPEPIIRADPGPPTQADMALTSKAQPTPSCLCSRRLGVDPVRRDYTEQVAS